MQTFFHSYLGPKVPIQHKISIQYDFIQFSLLRHCAQVPGIGLIPLRIPRIISIIKSEKKSKTNSGKKKLLKFYQVAISEIPYPSTSLIEISFKAIVLRY